MSEKVTVYGRDGYIDHIGHLLRLYRKERGTVTTPSGSIVPLTTNADVKQVARWYDAEVKRLTGRRSHDHPLHDIWRIAYERIQRDTAKADDSAQYPDNAWFWFEVLIKLARHLEEERSTPTKMELILESIEEAVDDRVDDVGDLLEGATKVASKVASTVGDAADAVAETGQSIWSAVKVVAVVGVVGIGAALVVPPIVRAVRASKDERTPDVSSMPE